MASKIRASWARSFKAPTLFQQNIFSQAILVPAAAFGAGTGTDTVFLSGGGNPNLQPERARSWTAGVEFEPIAFPELTLSATWYDIRYDDRVVAPIAGSIAAAINNPGYASLIDFSPDPAELANLIAGAQFGLENFTGQPFDPADVLRLLPNLLLIDVHREPMSFMIRLAGSKIEEFAGENLTGKRFAHRLKGVHLRRAEKNLRTLDRKTTGRN